MAGGLRLTIGRKLGFSSALSVLLLAAVAGMAWWAIGSLSSSHHAVTGSVLPEMLAADAVAEMSPYIHESEDRYVLNRGVSYADHLGDVKEFRVSLARLAALSRSADDRAAVAAIRSAYAQVAQLDARVHADVVAGRYAQAEALIDGPVNDAADRLTAAAAAYQKREGRAEAAADAGFASTESTARLLGVLLAVAAALVGAGVAYLVARGIRRGSGDVLATLRSLRAHCLADLQAGMQAMAGGDLTRTVTPVTPLIERISGDEIGEAATETNEIRRMVVETIDAYEAMRTRLAAMVDQIRGAASSLSTGSQQMASSSEEAGKAVGEIAQAVQDVAAGAEQQVHMVEQTRSSSEQTGQAAEHADEVARHGVAAAEQATAAMQELRDSTDRVTVAIRALSNKSEEIGGIVETITGIAAQTNLLALNAAIEAARAGERGKGFAVVADEVRKLAEESQQAAATIAALLEQIQAETESTVAVVEESSAKADESSATVDSARAAFRQIGESVEGIRAQIAQIVEAAGEVAAVAEQSSASTEQVSASTQQTAASTQQIAASAQELANTAEELNRLVGQFTLAA